MVRVSKTKLKNILTLLPALLFADCANQLPPGGGEFDLVPPEIIEVYPADGTVEFNDDFFELGFSEYVERRSVKDAIFISPAIEGELELDWSGKYVRVYFPEELKKNVTYVVTIGTDVVDYNNRNQMANAFTFTFATGKEIDKRVISGKIYDKKPQGVLLFAYIVKDEFVNPSEMKPDYISQSNADGSYRIAGLASGLYRIFAVRDEFRDLIYQPEQDEIGIPYREVFIAQQDTLINGLVFRLTKIDTVRPRLIYANMTDMFHILVNCTEELDAKSITASNFYLYDSTENKRVQIQYAFKGNTKPSEFVLVPNEVLTSKNLIYLFVDTLKDLSGNIYMNDFAELSVSEKTDTSKPELYKTIPLNNSNNVDFLAPSFTFLFNDAFNREQARSGILFTDTLTKKNVPFEVSFFDDAAFVIRPLNKLDASKNYSIIIDMSKIKDFAGNYHDTVYNFSFKTISGLEFTGASGILLNFDDKKNAALELIDIDKLENKYLLKPAANGMFNFNRVLPGKYLLFAYYDKDSSNTYSFGKVYPFSHSEEFSFYPDTLNLRARWIETDLKFNFKSR